MTEIYRTTITEAGPDAEAFLDQGMFVTFGENAPEALREFCFLVAPAASTAPILPGQELRIDTATARITAVGDLARRNLDALGHVTISLDAAATASMDGTIHVQVGPTAIRPKVGSELVIEVP